MTENQMAKGKRQMANGGGILSHKRHTSKLLPFAICLLPFAFLSSCVPVPPELLPQVAGSGASAATSYPDIEPGGVTVSSLHFTLRGYNEQDLKTFSARAEDIFNKIGMDIGLYSYLAGQTYTLVVYKDQLEYSSKTKQPMGSTAVMAGTVIYTYLGPESGPELAHQMTHMIFKSYMGEKAALLHWLDEGLAMHEEIVWMPDTERVALQTVQANKLRTERMPFSQMSFFAGNSEERRRQDVWYLQVESVVSYLLKQGTSLTFTAFLNELRNGADLDHALTENYTGKFRSMADFETSWQASI